MKNKLTKRDWELVSQYIDNQLSPRARSRLEARLQNEAALQTAVEQMEQTRRLVRSLPPVRAPRNYTLTPAMVPRPALLIRLLPTFQLASALATILFVLVIAGDLFGFLSATSQDAVFSLRAAEPEMAFQIELFPTTMSPSFLLEQQGETMAMEAEEMVEEPAAAEPFAQAPFEDYTADALTQEAEAAAPAAESDAMGNDLTPMALSAEERGLTEYGMGGGDLTPMAGAATEAAGTPVPTPTPEPTPSPTAVAIGDVAADGAEEPASEKRGLTPDLSRFLVRVIEVSLAAAAVIFAAIAFWLRRQGI